MDKETVVKIVDQFRKKIEAQGISPLKIILYGSYSRGSNKDGSDIDIVIISYDFRDKNYWERIDIMSEVIYEIFAPIEAVAMTMAEWEDGELFVTDFAKDGEVLFAA